MARSNPTQNSFVAGEISPRLEGREDLPQYVQSMRIAENGTVLPHGGFTRRSGSAFVAEVKDSDDETILVDFRFSIEQAYVIEVGDIYARFYTNQGRIEDPPGTPTEIVTPWVEADLQALRWAQSNDVLIMTNPNNFPQTLTRVTDVTFSITDTVFRVPPLRAFNLDDTMTVAMSSSGTTATAVGFTFTADDVGRHIMVEHTPASDVTHDYYRITSQAGATATTTKFQSVTQNGVQGSAAAADTIAATDTFALGLFSDTEGATEVLFHEGRLFFGGTTNEPDRFVGSVSDDFFNFSIENPDLDDAGNSDRAISRRVVGNEQATIQWMVSADEQMFIGGTGQEFTLRALDNGILTPSAAVVRPLTTRGSEAVKPVVVDNQVIFVSGQKLRELIFDERNSGFRARDITILAEHILNAGVRELAYQQDPDSIIWVRRGDGQLIGFTFEREQEIIGAHRHTFGGTFGSGNAVLESMAVIPEPNDDIEDQLWVIVKRTINSVTRRYVEYVDKQFRPDVSTQSTQQQLIDAIGEGRFVDSFVRGTGIVSTTVTGLDHLIGETVQILSDGSVHPDRTVDMSGEITLETIPADGTVVIGLGYTTRGMTQRYLVGGTQIGSGLGMRHRIKRMIFMLYNTLGLRYGASADNVDTLEFRTASDPMDQSPPLVHTGFRDVAMPSPGQSWTYNPVVYFEQNQPLPLTVLAITVIADTEERD